MPEHKVLYAREVTTKRIVQRGHIGAVFLIDPAEETVMWRCTVCGYIYDDAKEGTKFEDLPDDWSCPVCNAPKDAFVRI